MKLFSSTVINLEIKKEFQAKGSKIKTLKVVKGPHTSCRLKTQCVLSSQRVIITILQRAYINL